MIRLKKQRMYSCTGRKMRRVLVWLVLIVFTSIILLSLFGFPWRNLSSQVASFNFKENAPTTNSSKPMKKKVILSWTTFFSTPMDDKYFDGCPDLRRNCTLTTDRKVYAEADAFVFHLRNMEWIDLPPSRTANQRYVFLMHESPPHTCLDVDYKPNFFNWSMTYRLDSDVPYPYTYLAKDPNARQDLNESVILNKSTSHPAVVWFVSNCHTHSRRELYADALQKYIPVDVYGACGPLKCAKSISGGILGRSACENLIDQEYKFYIAFENSICTDYVSEKYYARRDYNSVPIVLSRRVAERLFPPNSFIAADDYPEGPRQLADHLKYLMKNDTAYLEYFRWKTIGYAWVGRNPTTSMRFGFCGLCEKLLLLDAKGASETKSYESVNAWWGEKVSCDANLVNALVAKDLQSDKALATRHEAKWSSKRICG